MRISDWSSDVCSSDLTHLIRPSTPEATMHRTLPVLLLALVPALASAQATDASRALAQDAVLVDTHIDAPGMLMDGWMDLGEEAEGREFDYPKARAGGLDVARQDERRVGKGWDSQG